MIIKVIIGVFLYHVIEFTARLIVATILKRNPKLQQKLFAKIQK